MARMCLALALFVLQCGIANAVPLAFAPGLENDAAEGVRTDFGFDYMHLVQVCCDAHNISWSGLARFATESEAASGQSEALRHPFCCQIPPQRVLAPPSRLPGIKHTTRDVIDDTKRRLVSAHRFPPQQDGFLLHGLWPEFLNGSWPQFCDSSSPYNASAIKDLLPELHKYWPSLVSPDQVLPVLLQPQWRNRARKAGVARQPTEASRGRQDSRGRASLTQACAGFVLGARVEQARDVLREADAAGARLLPA
eukprot:1956860-Rhodomonas_salina.1